jgi:hypothetical protein
MEILVFLHQRIRTRSHLTSFLFWALNIKFIKLCPAVEKKHLIKSHIKIFLDKLFQGLQTLIDTNRNPPFIITFVLLFFSVDTFFSFFLFYSAPKQSHRAPKAGKIDIYIHIHLSFLIFFVSLHFCLRFNFHCIFWGT